MAIIKSGASTDQLTVEPTSKSARITTYDTGGRVTLGDWSDVTLTSTQGFYVTSGFTSAIVAAALAANTNLMSFRVQVSSTRRVCVTRFRFFISPATVGASGGVSGVIALQRFTAQTPTGGTARTAARKDAGSGAASDVTDIRDSNAALTGTAPTWGDIVGSTVVPLFTTGGSAEWIFEPGFPVVLLAGDGIGLRTQVAMAATQTWTFSYNIHWYER